MTIDTIEAKKTLLQFPEPFYIERDKKVVDKLVEQLTRDFFVAVTGKSGSGKSTFVKQTLQRRLQTTVEKDEVEGANGTDWRIVTTAPYADPIGNLAVHLSKQGGLFPLRSKDTTFRDYVEKLLREDSQALINLYKEAAKNQKPFNFLLIVDQKQELFRYREFLSKQGPEEHKQGKTGNADAEQPEAGDDVRYINLLLAAAESKLPIYVVFVSDARYLEYFSRYRGLPEAMNNHRFSVPDITVQEVKTTLADYLEQTFSDRLMEGFSVLKEKGDPYALQKLNLFLWLVKKEWRSILQTDDKQAKPTFLERLKDELAVLKEKIESEALKEKNDSREIQIQKRNLFLWLVDKNEDPGKMGDVIEYFIENDVYKQLKPLEQTRCALLFKAMTEKGGGNQPIRRPIFLEKLQGLGKRDIQSLFPDVLNTSSAGLQTSVKQAGMNFDPQKLTAISLPEIRDLLGRFNISNEKFIRISGSMELSPRSIADIDSESLLYQWPRLNDWIDLENAHAGVYKKLVQDAVNYFEKQGGDETQAKPTFQERVKDWFSPLWHKNGHKDPAVSRTDRKLAFLQQIKVWTEALTKKNDKKEPDQSPVYKGAELVSARNWKTDCLPDANWAKRYDPAEPDKQQAEQRKKFRQKDLAGKSNLELALGFLAISEQHEEDENAQKQRTVDNALRLRKSALIGSAVASAACIAALALLLWVDRIRQKEKLIDFVEFLEYQGALDIPATHRFKRMEALYNKVKHTKINFSDRFLDRAVDKTLVSLAADSALRIDPGNNAMRAVSFAALRNMSDLLRETKTDDTEHTSRRKIEAVYDTAIKARGQDFVQFPHVYYALSAHLKELTRGNHQDSDKTKSNIEESALVSNPKAKHEFAYGDKNGRIFIKTWKTTLALPGINSAIKGMGFSRDGKKFFVGAEDGNIYRYDREKINAESAPTPDLYQDFIYKDGGGKTVYFIEEWTDPDYLLVSNTEQVYFLHRKSPGANFFLSGKEVKIPMDRVGYTDWSPDRRWFFAAGKDRTLVYSLDPENQNIEETARIRHTGITMLDLAIKFDTTGGQRRVWLALGSEEGDVWIAHTDTTLLTGGVTDLDASIFVPYPGVHESSITGLEFNGDLPQMASSSLDGTVCLWNLDALDTPYDHIRLRNKGQGIVAITYVNRDELVAHEAITNWVIKTNITALKKQLDCLIKNCPDGADQ